MDPQVFQNVLLALETVHSPSSSNESRRTAQEFLDQVKSNVDPFFAVFCIHRNYNRPEIMRHFGLHVLDHIVKHKWNNLNIEDREKLKSVLLDLVNNGVFDITTEKTFTKEKLSQLLAELAKRDWPQRWTNFHEIIIQNLSTGAIQADISLSTLRSLTDDLFNYQEDIDERRRTEMLGGITASLPIFLPHLKEFLILQIRQMEAAPNTPAGKINERLALSTLTALTAFLDWIPLNHVKENDVINILCTLLRLPQIRGKAIECLLVLVSRKVRPEERDFLLPLFDYLESFLAVLRETDVSKGDIDEEAYTFQKRVCQVLVDLGTAILLGKSSKLPESFPKYLEILLIFTAHASHMISSFVIPFWVSALKIQNILDNVAFQAILPQLLHTTSVKTLKMGDPDQSNSPSCHYSVIDFETGVEYRKFFSVLRSRTLEVIRLIGDLRPLETAQFIRDSVVNFLANVGTPTEKLTVHHQSFIIWEARTTVLENVFTSFKPKIFETAIGPPLIAVMNETLKLTLDFSTSDPLLVTRNLTCFQSFYVLFEVNRDLMNPVLEKIFSLVTFTQGSEPKVVDDKWSLSEDSLAVRRKACSSLVRYGMQIPQILLPLFDTFWKLIQERMGNNLVTSGEKTFLIEFLTLLSNAAPDPNGRLAFLATVTEPLTKDWENSPHVGDQQTFFATTGIQLLAQIVNETKVNPAFVLSEEHRALLQRTAFARRQLYFLANTLYVLFKRVNLAQEAKSFTKTEDAIHPLSPFIPRLLGPALSLVRLIHNLWNYPHSWVNIPQIPEIQAILTISETERAFLLGEEPPQIYDDEVITHTFVLTKEIRKMRTFLGTIRDAIYNLLGQMCFAGASFYGIPGLSDAVIDNVFSFATAIESRHLRVLDHVFVKAFLTKSPAHLMDSALSRFIPAYFNFIGNKLSAEWSAFNKITQNKQEDEDRESESEEIIAEKVLRDLTKGYSEIMLAIFNPKHALDSVTAEAVKAMDNLDHGSSNKQLVQFVLFHKAEITEPIINSMISSLTWKDTIHVRRMVSVCFSIVPLVITRPEFHVMFADSLLKASLQNLNDGYFLEVHSDVIALITLIYQKYRPISDLPLQVFSTLPNMTPAKLTAFDEQFRKEKAEKKLRSLMKGFLQDVTGKNIGSWFKDKVSILNLPEKLFINRLGGMGEEATNAEVGLFELFNMNQKDH